MGYYKTEAGKKALDEQKGKANRIKIGLG